MLGKYQREEIFQWQDKENKMAKHKEKEHDKNKKHHDKEHDMTHEKKEHKKK